MDIPSFSSVAKYLGNPLVLVGFVLFLVFGIHRSLIKSGLIPRLDQQSGSAVVKLILRYGFWLAVLLIGAGFGYAYLSYKEDPVSRADATIERLREQQDDAAIDRILVELTSYAARDKSIILYVTTKLKSYIDDISNAGDENLRRKKTKIISTILSINNNIGKEAFSNGFLSNVDLAGVNFSRADMREVDFSDSH